MAYYRDRFDAGIQLADLLKGYAGQAGLLVLALPRGGVPVGYEIARGLRAPLDILLIRKLGVPGQEELAMGAIASDGVRVLNPDVVRALGIPESVIDQVTRREQQELERRDQVYRDDRPFPSIDGRTVILVDDGLATGASMHAAVLVVREKRPARLAVAVPVGAPETCQAFEPLVDEIVCALTPAPFYGVGAWYDDFSQVSDDEVRRLLAEANEDHHPGQESTNEHG